uniref:NADH-ubiquinone oxidoreductase chain 4 n=1 Tax=Conchocele cf. bisecta HPD1644 TaxID=1872713 RepID=A0A1B4WRI4_9BIVA|nr:NADH dehydrogenase subunit 4 [Conchocele cf. bisecta HPD1644]
MTGFSVMASVMVSIFVSVFIPSNLIWCGMLAGVGFILWLMMSLLSYQIESIVCVSFELISGSLSNSLVVLTLWVYMLSILVTNMMKKSDLQSGYLGLLGLLTLICCLFFSVSDFFYMYLFFEGVLIPIVFMILGWGRQPERFEAGMYMLIYTILGSLPLLMCLVWFWSVSVNSFFLLGDSFSMSWVMMIMLSLAFCIKMPLFGFHGWLPKAHVEAPVAGSMMLAGILLKMGVYGLVMFYWFVGIKYIWGFEFFMVIGGIGGVISGVICCYQSDMKALIAYSSVSHMCFLMVGFMSMGWLGWEGMILMSLSHGVCSPWLFFLANYLSEVMGTRSLFLLKGVLLSFPLFSMIMFVCACCNMAVPPCVAMVAELSLFISGSNFSMYLVFPMMLICFIAAAYSLNMYSMINHGGLIMGTKMDGSINSRCVLGSVLVVIPLWVGILVVDILGYGG